MKSCLECPKKHYAKGLCRRHYRIKHYNTNKDIINENRRTWTNDWRKSHPEENKDRRYRDRLRREYGITPEQKENLWRKQNGLCAICGDEIGLRISNIDHDHKTGSIRGLLCGHCNRGLGMFKENTFIMASAINYIHSGGAG